MKNYRKVIPNLLTITRLVLTPVIIILGLVFAKYKLVIILATISALTDLFDGKLARKWNTVSDKGAKLDAVADKAFGISLTLCLVRKVRPLIIIVVLEIFIALFNLYYYYKKIHHANTLMVGKFKITVLFLTIILSMICIFYPKITFIRNGFIYATINLQILCLIFYFLSYINYEEEIVEIPKHQSKIYDYELEKTKKIDNLKDLIP